ncbi:energy transducer TonB [Burkholderia contaminans]|uniref:energy transducer TonB n=1 Tax=Burkholderia contaminans TaxID=488447 RepID=UPI00241627CC|nr:energy transducer TonB [Burkholderia contaminans]WFN14883.1 energy transducer TonB [Burkholderia contaminans]
MGLLDKILSRAVTVQSNQAPIVIRVLLDDEGRIQDIVLKRSCGDASKDQVAIEEIRQMNFPRGKLGSGPKTSRRWHEFVYRVAKE